MKRTVKRLLKPFPRLDKLTRRLYQGVIYRTSFRFSSAKASYAQIGEDLIISVLMRWIGIAKPSYLDIGANHPTCLSNTYLFYLNGCRGVCVEPNPRLCARFAARRKRDKCLNVGIGTDNTVKALFYLMSSSSLNTFSKKTADEYVKAGYFLERTIEVPLITINKLIADNFERWPNLVSLDIEGLDYTVMKTFDFAKYRPEVFCIETLTHSGTYKDTPLIDLMQSNGYIVFADTHLNTIFLERKQHEKILSVPEQDIPDDT